jgi:hypothetical protein
MVLKKGLDARECLRKDISEDLNLERLEDAIVDLPPSSSLDFSELTYKTDFERNHNMKEEYSELLSDKFRKNGNNEKLTLKNFSPVELTQVPSYPPDFEKTIKFGMPDSSDFYSLKNGNLLATHSQKTAKLYYSRLFPHDLHPRCAYSSPGIDLPIQETISLNPSERILCDTHLKFLYHPTIMANWCQDQALLN